MFDEFNDFDINRFDLNAFDLSNLIINEFKDKLALNNLNEAVIQSFKLNEIDYSNFDFDNFNLKDFLRKNFHKISDQYYEEINLEIFEFIDELEEGKDEEDKYISPNHFHNHMDNEYLTIQRHMMPRIHQQIFLFFAKLADSNKSKGYTITSHINDLATVLRIDNNRELVDFNHIFNDLESNIFEILIEDSYDGSQSYTDFNNSIVSYELYEDGTFNVEFEKDVYLILERIKNETSLLDSNDIFKLHSRYSLLLYELLTVFPDKINYDFSLIKDFLAYYWDNYESSYQISNFIIEPAIIDINENTDLNVDYEIIRDDFDENKILAFRFNHSKKTEF